MFPGRFRIDRKTRKVSDLERSKSHLLRLLPERPPAMRSRVFACDDSNWSWSSGLPVPAYLRLPNFGGRLCPAFVRKKLPSHSDGVQWRGEAMGPYLSCMS